MEEIGSKFALSTHYRSLASRLFLTLIISVSSFGRYYQPGLSLSTINGIFQPEMECCGQKCHKKILKKWKSTLVESFGSCLYCRTAFGTTCSTERWRELQDWWEETEEKVTVDFFYSSIIETELSYEFNF